MTTASCSVQFADAADDNLRRTILDGVRQFNRTRLFPDQPDGQDLAIAVHDPTSAAPVGGLLGRTSGGWLFVELIFVPEAFRGMGLATRLLAMAEEEALRRGCHGAWLDTLNPAARDLYARLGYEVFGELKDYPVGSSRYFLQKKLGAAAGP